MIIVNGVNHLLFGVRFAFLRARARALRRAVNASVRPLTGSAPCGAAFNSSSATWFLGLHTEPLFYATVWFLVNKRCRSASRAALSSALARHS